MHEHVAASKQRVAKCHRAIDRASVRELSRGIDWRRAIEGAPRTDRVEILEREADRVGMTILTGSGWAGQGMVELFEMLGREAGRDRASVSDFLSSHPSPQDRIENLSQVSRRLGGTHDSARFRSMKARIGRLPASRPGHNR